RSGSRASWPGYDYLMQAEAGYLSLTGEPDGPPARFGLSIVDLMTGTTAAMVLLAGLVDAQATGKGRDLDVSLFDVALHNLAYVATWYLNGGIVTNRQPRSSHPSLTPSQLCRTKDGWLFIMCNKEKFWTALADAVGKPEWATDPEYSTFAARLKNREQVTQELDAFSRLRRQRNGSRGWEEKCRSLRSTTCSRHSRTRLLPSSNWCLISSIPSTARFAELPRRFALRTARCSRRGKRPD